MFSPDKPTHAASRSTRRAARTPRFIPLVLAALVPTWLGCGGEEGGGATPYPSFSGVQRFGDPPASGAENGALDTSSASGQAEPGQSEGNGSGSGDPGSSDGTVGVNEGGARPDQIAGGQQTPAGNTGQGQPGNTGDDTADVDDGSDDTAGTETGQTDPNNGGGNSGGFTPPPGLSGGASAAFICAPNQTYGDPISGVGAGDVQSFGAPPGDFFAFIEGPVWVASLGTLFFSDNARDPDRIYQLTPPSTETSLFMGDAGSNGLALDGNDQLVLADEFSGRVTVVDPRTASVTDTLVPASEGITPNDLIMRSDGNLYFTEPSSGLYRRAPDGTVTGPINQSNCPAPVANANGVVLSTDENVLFVGSVFNNSVSSFSLLQDGTIDAASGQLFVRTSAGTVDGMAVDCAGNLYVGTDGGVEVYSPSGQAIGVIPTGYASNCTFGGPERRTLYVTSQGQLKAVQLNVPGLPN